MSSGPLRIYPPAGAPTGQAVLVLPGGGYRAVADTHEGTEPAQWLAAQGIAAAVLRYPVAPHRHPAALHATWEAMTQLREALHRSGEQVSQIGVWGFSAGGHLAGLLATDAYTPGPARPDFLIAAYPVVTMAGPDTHPGSRDNLLGARADEAAREAVSIERRVSAATPPTFLMHTAADQVVPVSNSLSLYAALLAAGVPSELHVYPDGGHGVGLFRHPATSGWPLALQAWLARLRGTPQR